MVLWGSGGIFKKWDRMGSLWVTEDALFIANMDCGTLIFFLSCILLPGYEVSSFVLPYISP
jgi:hypothetical protein